MLSKAESRAEAERIGNLMIRQIIEKLYVSSEEAMRKGVQVGDWMAVIATLNAQLLSTILMTKGSKETLDSLNKKTIVMARLIMRRTEEKEGNKE